MNSNITITSQAFSGGERQGQAWELPDQRQQPRTKKVELVRALRQRARDTNLRIVHSKEFVTDNSEQLALSIRPGESMLSQVSVRAFTAVVLRVVHEPAHPFRQNNDIQINHIIRTCRRYKQQQRRWNQVRLSSKAWPPLRAKGNCKNTRPSSIGLGLVLLNKSRSIWDSVANI